MIKHETTTDIFTLDPVTGKPSDVWDLGRRLQCPKANPMQGLSATMVGYYYARGRLRSCYVK